MSNVIKKYFTQVCAVLTLPVSIIIAVLILVIGFWFVEEQRAVNICKNTAVQKAPSILLDRVGLNTTGHSAERNTVKKNCRKIHSFFKESEK